MMVQLAWLTPYTLPFLVTTSHLAAYQPLWACLNQEPVIRKYFAAPSGVVIRDSILPKLEEQRTACIVVWQHQVVGCTVAKIEHCPSAQEVRITEQESVCYLTEPWLQSIEPENIRIRMRTFLCGDVDRYWWPFWQPMPVSQPHDRHYQLRYRKIGGRVVR